MLYIHKKIRNFMLTFVVFQLEGSDRSGSNLSLRQLTLTPSRPHGENANQSPNKVTRSQSATSGATQKIRRFSHGGENNGSNKRWCYSDWPSLFSFRSALVEPYY